MKCEVTVGRQTAIFVEAVFSGFGVSIQLSTQMEGFTLPRRLPDISCVFLDILYTMLERHSEGGCTCTELVYNRTSCVR
jgi:hypothetical protein